MRDRPSPGQRRLRDEPSRGSPRIASPRLGGAGRPRRLRPRGGALGPRRKLGASERSAGGSAGLRPWRRERASAQRRSPRLPARPLACLPAASSPRRLQVTPAGPSPLLAGLGLREAVLSELRGHRAFPAALSVTGAASLGSAGLRPGVRRAPGGLGGRAGWGPGRSGAGCRQGEPAARRSAAAAGLRCRGALPALGARLGHCPAPPPKVHRAFQTRRPLSPNTVLFARDQEKQTDGEPHLQRGRNPDRGCSAQRDPRAAPALGVAPAGARTRPAE